MQVPLDLKAALLAGLLLTQRLEPCCRDTAVLLPALQLHLTALLALWGFVFAELVLSALFTEVTFGLAFVEQQIGVFYADVLSVLTSECLLPQVLYVELWHFLVVELEPVTLFSLDKWVVMPAVRRTRVNYHTLQLINIVLRRIGLLLLLLLILLCHWRVFLNLIAQLVELFLWIILQVELEGKLTILINFNFLINLVIKFKPPQTDDQMRR